MVAEESIYGCPSAGLRALDWAPPKKTVKPKIARWRWRPNGTQARAPRLRGPAWALARQAARRPANSMMALCIATPYLLSYASLHLMMH